MYLCYLFFLRTTGLFNTIHQLQARSTGIMRPESKHAVACISSTAVAVRCPKTVCPATLLYSEGLPLLLVPNKL